MRRLNQEHLIYTLIYVIVTFLLCEVLGNLLHAENMRLISIFISIKKLADSLYWHPILVCLCLCIHCTNVRNPWPIFMILSRDVLTLKTTPTFYFSFVQLVPSTWRKWEFVC